MAPPAVLPDPAMASPEPFVIPAKAGTQFGAVSPPSRDDNRGVASPSIDAVVSSQALIRQAGQRRLRLAATAPVCCRMGFARDLVKCNFQPFALFMNFRCNAQETSQMESKSHDVTAAMLVWLPNGAKPTPEDFDEQRQDLSPTVFPSVGGAVEHATVTFERGESNGRLPWIKVGSEIFDPDQVRSARSTVNVVKGRSPYSP
jgi:hypothetical protein